MSGTVFCRACGASINVAAPLCPQCGAPQGVSTYGVLRPASPGDGIPRDFSNSVQLCFRKYANGQGRAPRAEYWFFTLFTVIIQITAYLIMGVIHLAAHVTLHILPLLASLALLSPSISVSIRRLHDRNMSGWWFLPLIILNILSILKQLVYGFTDENFVHTPQFGMYMSTLIITGIWGLVLLILFCLRGTEGDNRFGPENGIIAPSYRL